MNPTQPKQKTELERALHACRDSFVPVFVFSLLINLLLFVSPLYMMQVYDRVLTTRSVDTLIMLTVLATIFMLLMAFFELIRSRLLIRAGVRLDTLINGPVFRAVFRISARQPGSSSAQALRDMDMLREFLSGGGIITLCDAPWVPIFLVVAFVFHPWIGVLSLVGAIIIFGFALANEMYTKKPLTEATRVSVKANAFVSTSLRNAEALEAMGMMRPILHRWRTQHVEVLKMQAETSDRSSTIMSSLKFIRLFLQTAILGLGAYLAVHNEISSGAMIAASIIMGRALGPVEQAVGQWKGFQSARGAYQRIRSMLLAVPTSRNVMALPRPDGVITVQNVIAAPPGARVPVLKNVTFQLQPGEVVGVIGPSAAGKSTLARVVLGIWPAASGTVRIDGAELSQWEPEDLGQYVGYLPQDVELFDGTISENISRFADPVDSAGVIAAAKKAGVHEMVLLMPEGYNTQIGAGGAALSGGQRQRVGLARALYGNPVLVVLDEPNSNLDAEGENALAQAILAMKQENRTILVITHRLQLLAAVDKVMVMNSGAVEAMGPRDEVLARYTRPTVVANNPQVTQNASSEPPASDNAAEGA